MQPRKQFTFYKSFLDAIESQPTARAQLALYRAVCRYAIYGEAPVFQGREEGIFLTIQPNLDAARRKSECGKRGGQISKRKAKDKQTQREKETKTEIESEIESKIESEIESEAEMENECITAAAQAETAQRHCRVMKAYETHCGSRLMPWELMTQTRKQTLDGYFQRGYTLADFEKVFQKAGQSAFLAKQNQRGWHAGIDWLLEEKNFARVLEGAFDDNIGPSPGGRELDQDELAAIQAMLREDRDAGTS